MGNRRRKEEGKIKGDGTPVGVCRGLHMGFGGTRRSRARAGSTGYRRIGRALPRAVRDRLRWAALYPPARKAVC
jgi:hypothetical protein